MRTRRAAFWVTVAGVSVLANFAMEVLADKLPSSGFGAFVGFLHRGPGGGTS